MPKPDYTIELISNTVDPATPIEQLNQNTGVSFGRNNTTRFMGQDFTTVSAFLLTQVTFQVGKSGSPGDNLRVKLYQSDKSTLIATSITLIPINILPSSGHQNKIFFFSPAISLSAATNYHLAVERTGGNDVANYPRIAAENPGTYGGGQAWRWDQDILTWITYFGWDLYFKIEGIVEGSPVTKDITDDVLSVNSNRGQIEVDGSIKEGRADLVLDNRDKRYTQFNTSSDLFGLFRVIAEIKITAVFSAVTYNIFRGFIRSIDPDLKFNTQTVIVSAADRFYLLKEEKTTTALLSGKTADEIIEAVLVDIGLSPSEYSLDADVEILENIQFTDANAFQSIALAVEVGQHHHFISADGIYTFKTNLWLDDNTPKYTFNYDDPAVDAAVIPIEHDGIYNEINVTYGAFTETQTDAASQLKYGLKEFNLDNELMPDADNTYASFIANYLLGLFKEPGNGLELTISNVFPEVLNIDIGDPIRFIHPPQSLDEIYTVFGVTHRFDKSQNHALVLLCRKWVDPPIPVSFFEPFAGDTYIVLDEDTNEISQGFKQPANFKVSGIFLTLKSRLDISREIRAYIHTADGSGFPTGAALATSNVTIIPAGIIPPVEDTYRITFPIGEQPTLTGGVQYVMKIDSPKTNQAYLPGIANNGDLAVTANRTQYGMSFKLPTRGNVFAGAIWMNIQSTVGTGQIITVDLYTDSGGLPGTFIQRGLTFNVPNGFSGPNYGLALTFSPEITLAKNTKYWLVTSRTSGITWQPRGQGGNPYPDGELAEYNGSWSLSAAGEDQVFRLNINDFVNKWEVWGKAGNPYADGIPAEKFDAGAWNSLAPNDFYFKLEIPD